jgi:hypothetical protein
MANRFVDRRPTQPNRYKITQENGAEYYATLERADEPVEVGTPLNAKNLNDMLDKTGDTMTGSLNMAGGSYPTIYFTPPDGVGDSAVEGGDRVVSFHARDVKGESAPRRQFALYAPSVRTIDEAVRLIVTEADGSKKYYYLYGEHRKPTPAEIGAAPAVADSTYKNCYYRTVDGAKEWLNPPMVEGTEYRTTERFRNMPVYCQLIDCGEFTAGKTITCVDIYTNIYIVRFEGHVGFDGENDYAMQTQDVTVGTFDDYSKIQIKISNTATTRADTTMMVALYYVKGVPPVG